METIILVRIPKVRRKRECVRYTAAKVVRPEKHSHQAVGPVSAPGSERWYDSAQKGCVQNCSLVNAFDSIPGVFAILILRSVGLPIQPRPHRDPGQRRRWPIVLSAARRPVVAHTSAAAQISVLSRHAAGRQGRHSVCAERRQYHVSRTDFAGRPHDASRRGHGGRNYGRGQNDGVGGWRYQFVDGWYVCFGS